MKFKNICLGVALLAVFSSCSEEMDHHEYTTYDNSYVFTDFGRTASFVNNIYSYLDSDLPGNANYASACDEAEMAISWSSVFDYTNGGWSAINSKSLWGRYSGIRAANYFLKEGNNLDFYDLRFTIDYEAQMKRYNRYQYEVRLLRAYYYFGLVRAYGDIPFTTEVLSDKEANTMSRTSADVIFDFIISECDAVAPELPTTYTGLSDDAASGSAPDNGRVTRGTALALKARAALYRASKLFNTNEDNSLWLEAAKASKDVIDYAQDNGIKLGAYTDIWGTDNYKSKEMLFVRRMGDTNSPEYYNFPAGMENAQSGNCPTQNLVDAYEMVSGGEPDPNNPYEGRDPRMKMTIACNGDKWPNSNPNPLEVYVGGRNGLPVQNATPTSYYLKKYLDGSIDISAGNGTGGKRHSWVIFRLGEFYLNYAEAICRYTGSANQSAAGLNLTAVEAVNVVRNRTGVSMPGFPSDISEAEFWTRYKNERMVELAFEQHRFWDVRRWKGGGFTSIKRMVITKNEDGSLSYSTFTKPLTWDEKMYLFPIPQSECLKNSNLTQNPGW